MLGLCGTKMLGKVREPVSSTISARQENQQADGRKGNSLSTKGFAGMNIDGATAGHKKTVTDFPAPGAEDLQSGCHTAGGKLKPIWVQLCSCPQ